MRARRRPSRTATRPRCRTRCRCRPRCGSSARHPLEPLGNALERVHRDPQARARPCDPGRDVAGEPSFVVHEPLVHDPEEAPFAPWRDDEERADHVGRPERASARDVEARFGQARRHEDVHDGRTEARPGFDRLDVDAALVAGGQHLDEEPGLRDLAYLRPDGHGDPRVARRALAARHQRHDRAHHAMVALAIRCVGPSHVTPPSRWRCRATGCSRPPWRSVSSPRAGGPAGSRPRPVVCGRRAAVTPPPSAAAPGGAARPGFRAAPSRVRSGDRRRASSRARRHRSSGRAPSANAGARGRRLA